MNRSALRSRASWVVGLLLLPSLGFAQATVSHVRVVRLSYVSGTVGVKRPASTEWVKGLVNTPIQEGFELSTARNSYAEIEFENGSTARLGEFSKIIFDQLAIDGNGNKLNRLDFAQGYATFHFLPEHHDAYSVKISEATVTPNGKSEFRTDFQRGHLRLEVFSGSIDVATAAEKVKLGKDRVVEFDPQATQLALDQKQGITKDSWDKWSSERDTQTELSLTDESMPASGPRYGWSDLDTYGEWGFFPGFGYGWSPYVASGWAPYSAGMWNFYPGMGYTWTSGEPWGWLPYHNGNWNFANGFGWFWMPGENMNAWSPAMVNWYSGPGWIGWSPMGVFNLAGPDLIMTAPVGLVQNGGMITPMNTVPVPLGTGTRITSMPFQPGEGAMLPGERLSANAETLFAAPTAPHGASAPPSVLVAGDPRYEQSLRSSHQPLRARMGATLGGHYAVTGKVGEFRGDPFRDNTAERGFANGPNARPTMLAHGQQTAVFSQVSGGGMMAGGGGSVHPSVSMGSVPSGGGGGHAMSGAASGGGHH